MADADDFEWLRRLQESYRSIRFGRGVIGKTTYVMAALIGLWAVIAWRLSETSVAFNAALICVGAVATAVGVWWIRSTQSFAKENPAQALLDGAEFIEYEKLTAQIKGGVPFRLGRKHDDALIAATHPAQDEGL
jgi:hypothetical protein